MYVYLSTHNDLFLGLPFFVCLNIFLVAACFDVRKSISKNPHTRHKNNVKTIGMYEFISVHTYLLTHYTFKMSTLRSQNRRYNYLPT